MNNAIIGTNVNKVISAIELNSGLSITFEDGYILHVEDTGQNCCEERFVTCDDNLDEFIGARFRGIQQAKVFCDDYADCGTHEIVFINVLTTLGVFTLQTHNKHNGCYSGFQIHIWLTSPARKSFTDIFYSSW